MIEVNTKWAACIVYYQDLTSLQELINNLNSQTLKPSEIFIADNASRISVSIKNSEINVNVVKLNSNLGFGVAANCALNMAIEKGFDKFILFSQDVLLENSTCEKLITNLLSKKGVVFPTMINRKTNKIFSKGGSINLYTGKISLHTKEVPKNIKWADGSCLAFDKNTYFKVKGFSENFFMYFEDVDFCLKAKKNQIQINHVETIASQTPNGPTSYLRSRNSLLVARNYGNKFFVASVFVRNFLAAIFLLLKFKFKEAIQRFKGIKEGLKVNREND